MKYNIGLVSDVIDSRLIKKVILPLYLDVEGLDKADALAQFAMHNRNNDSDLIAIFPSYNNDPVLLERGRVYDKIYRGDSNV